MASNKVIVVIFIAIVMFASLENGQTIETSDVHDQCPNPNPNCYKECLLNCWAAKRPRLACEDNCRCLCN
ncbi:unnamed protein product [Lupinus luteus]|uniref:Uncharacterized protein n=1 Tax=Lupinus luteus TaxID=3873 RepID=A0AAV1W3G7_LUPLU